MNTVAVTITLPTYAATGDDYLQAIIHSATQQGDAIARAALYGLVPYIKTTQVQTDRRVYEFGVDPASDEKSVQMRGPFIMEIK